MIYNDILEGAKVYLRDLAVSDCEKGYANWLNDPEVNRYLECRLNNNTLESAQRYVLDMRESPDNYQFAIINKENDKHIGNIKIGPINQIYNNAYIGYIIGDAEYWGHGIATEAIRLVLDFGFNKLNLHKISAGVIAPNFASSKALENNGFKKEGELRDEILIDGAYYDTLKFGILKQEFEA